MFGYIFSDWNNGKNTHRNSCVNRKQIGRWHQCSHVIVANQNICAVPHTWTYISVSLFKKIKPWDLIVIIA
jgi:hypothetical protein